MKHFAFACVLLINSITTLAQINQANLDIGIAAHNSFSLSKDNVTFTVGKRGGVYLFKRGEAAYKKLEGTHAHLNDESKIIYIFEALNDSVSFLFLYNYQGEQIRQEVFGGSIEALTTSASGNEVYFILSKGGKDSVFCYNISSHATGFVFADAYELTTLNRLGSGNLAISGGGMNYIITPNGKVVKEIPAPHRSFGKTTSDGRFFCILQEISDGSSVEVYDSLGTLQTTFRYEHPKAAIQGTRRCDFCKTKNASFIDFDVSPDLRYLIGVDQFGYPYVFDKSGHLINEFRGEGYMSMRFFSFISEAMFLCYNSSGDTIQYLFIK